MNCCSRPSNKDLNNRQTSSAVAALSANAPQSTRRFAAITSRLTFMPSWLLAILDQAIVSGMRFATTIFLGRAAGAVELGHYSIAFMTFLAFGCLQEALVTTPFAIHYHRLGKRSRAAYAGGSLILHALLALIAGVSLASLGFVCRFFGTDPWFIHLAPLVAVVLPFSLMWEFARRSMLAQLEIKAVTRTDATAALIQILGLTCLTILGKLTAASALCVLALATSVTAWAWLTRTRAKRLIYWKLTVLYVRRNWRVGKWLACAQLIGIIHAMVPTLLLALMVNAAATGLFTAYFNFALLSNPLMLAVINLLLPKSAQAFKETGLSGAAQLVFRAAVAMACILACYVGVLMFWGDTLVTLVYGSAYLGHHDMLILLGLCTIAWSTSMSFATGLAALQRSRSSFIATLCGTMVSTLIIGLTAHHWSVTGAALGLCVGSYVAAILHVVFFFAYVRESTNAWQRSWPRPAAKTA